MQLLGGKLQIHVIESRPWRLNFGRGEMQERLCIVHWVHIKKP